MNSCRRRPPCPRATAAAAAGSECFSWKLQGETKNQHSSLDRGRCTCVRLNDVTRHTAGPAIDAIFLAVRSSMRGQHYDPSPPLCSIE